MSAVLLLIALLACGNIDPSTATYCTRRLDILLIVDGSSTVCNGTETCPAWNSTLEFCKNIATSFTIGPNDTKIAFMLMSDAFHVKWNLNGHTNVTTLLPAIGNVNYTGGVFTKLSLISTLSLITEIFNPSPVPVSGNRPEVLNVVIFILDGAPDVGPELGGTLSTTFQQDGIAAFIVGVEPGCTEKAARSLASPPKQVNETYFMVDGYFALDPVKDGLVNKICPYELPLLPGVLPSP